MAKKILSILFLILFLSVGCRRNSAGQPMGGAGVGPGGNSGGPKRCADCGRVIGENGSPISDAEAAAQQAFTSPGTSRENTGFDAGFADTIGANGFLGDGAFPTQPQVGTDGLLDPTLPGSGQGGAQVGPSSVAGTPSHGALESVAESVGLESVAPARQIASFEPPRPDEYLEEYEQRTKGVIDGNARQKLVRRAGPIDEKTGPVGIITNEGGQYYLTTVLGERLHLNIPGNLSQESEKLVRERLNQYVEQSKQKPIGLRGSIRYNLGDGPQNPRENYTDPNAQVASNSEYEFDLELGAPTQEATNGGL